MIKVMLILHAGGWSDAIRWDAIEPRIRVTTLGDIHLNHGFIESVVTPFGRVASDVRTNEAVRDYSRNVEESVPQPTIEHLFDPNFLAAWEEEFGASLDETRLLVDYVEILGVNAQSGVIRVRRSELLEPVVDGRSLAREKAEKLVDHLTFRGRPAWRDIPAGYNEKDRQPWRFRRRLSILRKPLVRIDDGEDPWLLVAPGLFRDALGYMAGNFHRGTFPLWQLKLGMRSWRGRSTDERGSRFNHEVADRMRELGWEARPEVSIATILGKAFKKFGDIDVLAWKPKTNRILMMECKDMQLQKTLGEIAEQLADFRGEMGSDGKPDLLLKHLNRVEVISAHLPQLEKYLQLPTIPGVEGHLIFRHPVPMQFAWDRMKDRTSLQIFDRLDAIKNWGQSKYNNGCFAACSAPAKIAIREIDSQAARS